MNAMDEQCYECGHVYDHHHIIEGLCHECRQILFEQKVLGVDEYFKSKVQNEIDERSKNNRRQ